MTYTDIHIDPAWKCTCGAVVACWGKRPDGYAVSDEDLLWECARVLFGFAPAGPEHVWPTSAPDADFDGINRSRTGSVENVATDGAWWPRKRNAPCLLTPVDVEIRRFEPGDVVEAKPEIMAAMAKRSWQTPFPPEIAVAETRMLDDETSSLRLDGIDGWWLSTGFRLVKPATAPEPPRVIVSTPPPRRQVTIPRLEGHEYVRLYSHAEILREAGKVLTTADFDLLIDNLEAL